jgi:hypothetical protein
MLKPSNLGTAPSEMPGIDTYLMKPHHVTEPYIKKTLHQPSIIEEQHRNLCKCSWDRAKENNFYRRHQNRTGATQPYPQGLPYSHLYERQLRSQPRNRMVSQHRIQVAYVNPFQPEKLFGRYIQI